MWNEVLRAADRISRSHHRPSSLDLILAPTQSRARSCPRKTPGRRTRPPTVMELRPRVETERQHTAEADPRSHSVARQLATRLDDVGARRPRTSLSGERSEQSRLKSRRPCPELLPPSPHRGAHTDISGQDGPTGWLVFQSSFNDARPNSPPRVAGTSDRPPRPMTANRNSRPVVLGDSALAAPATTGGAGRR